MSVLAIDPTRCASLRRFLRNGWKSRLRELTKDVSKAIYARLQAEVVTNDAGFAEWLRKHVAETGRRILLARGWLSGVMAKAFQTGVGRALLEAKKGAVDFVGVIQSKVAWALGLSRRQDYRDRLSLRQLQAESQTITTIDRAANEAAEAANNALSRGESVEQVAQEAVNAINSVYPALERDGDSQVTGSHADGELIGFSALGVDRIRLVIETAGDDRVCRLCLALVDVVFTVEESWGKIPVHRRCRCAWVLAD